MGKMKKIFQEMQEEGYQGDPNDYIKEWVKKNSGELIYERNPDTGAIRARKIGDHGNERIINSDEVKAGPVDLRQEIASDIWAANKVNHQGHWYVRLSDVLRIIEGDLS